MLFYDKLDEEGRIVERIEKFFPIPPIASCMQTTYGEFLANLSAGFISRREDKNLSSADLLQCCDFFENGQGYQFTLCDKGVGVYIINDRKGSQNDLMYLNMASVDSGFNNVSWNELYSLVDSYCGVNSLQ